jgi:hypothetical protein
MKRIMKEEVLGKFQSPFPELARSKGAQKNRGKHQLA